MTTQTESPARDVEVPPPASNGEKQEKRRATDKAIVRRVGAGVLAGATRLTRFLASRLTLGTALVLVVLTIPAWKHATSPAITLSLVSLPPSLAQTELSAQELTQLLHDKLDSLRRRGLTGKGGGFALASDGQLPDIEVPGVGIKLPQLVDLITGVFGKPHGRVIWEISARPQPINAVPGTAPGSTQRGQVWIMTAHLPDKRSHQVRFDPSNPEPALSAIARALLADAAPMVLERELMFADVKDCEFARALASDSLRHDASPKAMARMYNTLGVTAECPDDGAPSWREAARYYHAAIERDSEAVMPRVNLARIQMAQWAAPGVLEDGITDDSLTKVAKDSITKALSIFEWAAKRDSTIAALQAAWGWAYYLLGWSDSAKVHLEQAIKLDPTAPITYRQLAQVYFHSDSAAAIQQLSLGLARDPNDFTMLRDYGHALLSSGDAVGASRAFRRAHRADPNDIDTQFHLAESLQGAAREEALVHYCEVKRRTSRGEPYNEAADTAITAIVAAGHQGCPRSSK